MSLSRNRTARWLAIPLAFGVASCAQGSPDTAALPECDPDNGGITLPAGFCAFVFADLGAGARHIAVRPDGDVFVAMYASRDDPAGGGVVALRDTTGDGRADVRVRWGPSQGGSGIALQGDHIWFATDDAVLRYPLPARTLEPIVEPDTIVSGLPAVRSHRAKSIALSADGRIFVNIGSPSNACQMEDRQPGSPGMDPCPELETRAGIWVFDAGTTGQSQADGRRFATGIRNAVAIAVNPADGRLYAMQHGRDQLANWSELFDNEQSANKPAEELFAVDDGDDFGWPYCYYDPELGRKVLAPEYGGDGQTAGRCQEKEDPVFAFPAHWAPNGLLFYTGDQFPAEYRAGAFIAFHGSWNRDPLPQGGYNVTFLPFNAGAPLANHRTFADGFAGADVSPQGAEHRPVGLAMGPDGSVYITDDRAGIVWRVIYRGE
jgi:glucose/arabinose dehydrogenase